MFVVSSLFFIKCFAKNPLSTPSSLHSNVAHEHRISVGDTRVYSYFVNIPALLKLAVSALPIATWFIWALSVDTSKYVSDDEFKWVRNLLT